MTEWSATLPPEIVAALEDGTLEIGTYSGVRFIETSERLGGFVHHVIDLDPPLPRWAMHIARRHCQGWVRVPTW